MARRQFVMIAALICLTPAVGLAAATHDVTDRLPKIGSTGTPTTKCTDVPIACVTAIAVAAVTCGDDHGRFCAATVYGGVKVTDLTGELSGHGEYTFVGNLGAEGTVTAVTGHDVCDFRPGDGGCEVGESSISAVDHCVASWFGCHAEAHAEIVITATGFVGIKTGLLFLIVGQPVGASADDKEGKCYDDEGIYDCGPQ